MVKSAHRGTWLLLGIILVIILLLIVVPLDLIDKLESSRDKDTSKSHDRKGLVQQIHKKINSWQVLDGPDDNNLIA
jgi:hypothetical protein